MKKYLKFMFAILYSFAISLIFTNFCYAQAQVAKLETPVVKKNFAFERKFFEEMPLNKINSESVPVCKDIFTKSCGQADFPKMKNFTSCLQEKFETFKINSDCVNLAHALVYTAYLGVIPRTVKQCQVFFEKCELMAKKDTSLGIIGCVKREPNLPPVCVKLVSESYNYRKSLALIYDRKLAPDMDYKK